MHLVPFITVTTADTVQVRPGALGAPLERPVIDEFSGQ